METLNYEIISLGMDDGIDLVISEYSSVSTKTVNSSRPSDIYVCKLGHHWYRWLFAC